MAPPLPLDAVDRLVIAGSVDIPKNAAISRGICAQVAVHGSGENDAGNYSDGGGLRWAASGPVSTSRMGCRLEYSRVRPDQTTDSMGFVAVRVTTLLI
jgi:hypothetical protein